METTLFILGVGLAIIPWFLRRKYVSGRAWLAPLGLAAAGLGCLLWWNPGSDLLAAFLPAQRQDDGYVRSEKCRACHPDQYQSWFRSYHRTMTQPATAAAVLAPFDGLRLHNKGRTYRLERTGDEFWVEMPDPAWEMHRNAGSEVPPLSEAPRVRARVVMTTGSHHLQTYWIRREDGSGMLFQLPWVFRLSDRRWLPSEDSFLQPKKEEGVEVAVWNSACIVCHSVGGEPKIDLDNRTMFSRTAELGIACEACHGKADEHVRINRDPRRRYRLHLGQAVDSTIVNPSRLSPRLGSQVCGQCHSASNEKDTGRWTTGGRTYRVGEELEETRYILRYTENPTEPWMIEGLRENPEALTGRFWRDGTMRVAGREYNALIESACAQRGPLSCLSCHSMHSSAPNDQLAHGMDGDGACLGCHESYRNRIPEHTRHKTGSSGSSCYNCHMPYTSYGLFTAMRSHRIDNPSVETSVRTGRPNACNLCHLDQTLAWSARYLSQWYGLPEVSMSRDEKEIAASLLWLLRGDAVQRVVTAWSMGWEPALAVSGRDWQAPFLSRLLEDPYSAVRSVAYRSLQGLPGYRSFPFDFIGSKEAFSEAARKALERWTWAPDSGSVKEQLLFDPAGALKFAEIMRLLRDRDDRPVEIIE